ncbi:hypothetical protein P691DRAFT_695106 [Macrolepiota fuliginosa MF-IS2]|uniref:Uncharacterized protein n=1 Tax=Macrolepiota fuliginosa MF-IS2 TaxID=1400762 RepID=A0A9P5XL00_9AGAR|nr:hypothetical protein P691DRAFT_695106 [Macrolepiota fuliginosa MF-IS2]
MGSGEVNPGVDVSPQETITALSASTSLYDGDSVVTLRELFADYSSPGAALPESIYPFSPTLGRRYELGRTVQDEAPTRTLKPLSLSFRNEERLPQGWQRHVHPGGLPYFCLPVSDTCPMRILTEEWLFDSDTARVIEYFVQSIRNSISQHGVCIPEMSDLVLELYRERDPWMCGYYFVHHLTRSIYWLEEANLEFQCEAIKQVRGKIAGYQIETCLEVEYWAYWDCFPTVQVATPEIHQFAVDTLVSAMADVISSRTSTITRTYETLQNMLNVVQISRDSNTSNWHIGRFMKEMVSDRLQNYHGVWGARLSRDQAVLECTKPEKRSKFLKIFSPLLFFIPHAQLQRVEPLVIDRSVITIHWDKFFQELQEEWSQTMTVATIMLTANCAFLAIPMFQSPPNVPDTHSTPEQVSSYLSLATSLFSLILGVVMYREHRTNRPGTAAEILSHIFNNTTADSGLVCRIEHLVLIWSLPHALLLWSVLTFLLAFVIMCFSGTLTSAKVLVALSTGLLNVLVFYYIIRFGGGRRIRLRWWGCLSRGFKYLGKLAQRATKGLRRKPRKGDDKIAATV